MKEFPVNNDCDLVYEFFMKLYMMAEMIDIQAEKHIQKIGWLSGRLSELLGMSADFCANIEYAAPLHDIGNIVISDTILKKPYRITYEEKKRIEDHTMVGYDILKDTHSEILQMAALIAKYHHERFDGSGYPEGLCGNQIPLSARIVGVADSFDAIINTRPYKTGKPIDEALAEMERLSGTLYDSEIVKLLPEMSSEIRDQYKEVS
jgi:putative two-component system response regulator